MKYPEASRPFLLVGADHRLDFCKEIIGCDESPGAADRETAANLKNIIFESLKSAVEQDIPASSTGFWSDHDLGEGALLRSKAMGINTAVSLDKPSGGIHKSGYGWDVATRFNARMIAARIQYNPNGPILEREIIQNELRNLTNKCKYGDRSLLIELVVHPTQDDIMEYGSKDNALALITINSIHQLLYANVEPDVWAIHPPKALNRVSAAVPLIDDRKDQPLLFCIGEYIRPDYFEERPHKDDIETTILSAKTDGVDGILLGPGAYYGPLLQFHRKEISEEEAIQIISGRFIYLWHSCRGIFEEIS